jgi:hypothetical protein
MISLNNTIKRVLVALFFICILSPVYSKNYKIQAKYFCVRNNETEVYTKWVPSEITGFISSDDKTIVLYSKDIQVYYIYDINEDRADGTYFLCTDKNGVRMRVRFQYDIYKNCNGLTHLYVDYDDYTWGYLVEITKR